MFFRYFSTEERVGEAQYYLQWRYSRTVANKVVAVIEQGVVLNIGADDGVRMQQRLRVYRLMEVEGLTDRGSKRLRGVAEALER